MLLQAVELLGGNASALAEMQALGISEPYRDLVGSLLQVSQDKRPTAAQALQHPWLQPDSVAEVTTVAPPAVSSWWSLAYDNWSACKQRCYQWLMSMFSFSA